MSIELDELSGLMAGARERPSLGELLDFYQPSWMRDALCREYPGVNFFPAKGEKLARPRAVCADCLVRRECLDYALENELVGVWAGTSDAQRAQALRQGLDAVALLAMMGDVAGPKVCCECSKAGQRLRRGLCPACYQRARASAA